MLTIQQGLKEDGFEVSLMKLSQWWGVARRTVYYPPTKAPPKVRPELAVPIRKLMGLSHRGQAMEDDKNTEQRIFQLRGWQIRKRPVGHRPRIEALPSVATAPNQRWATDLCRVGGGPGTAG